MRVWSRIQRILSRRLRRGGRQRYRRTADNVRIAFRHYRSGHNAVLILAHGFYNNKDAYLFRSMAETLCASYDVISFDFRGHGKSGGLFTWTVKESQDVRTMVAYAREQGYQRIGIIGFSLGAAIALLEAGSNRDIQSIVSVSAPCDFWKIDCHFWEPEMIDDLKLNLGMKGKGKLIRPGNPFLPKVAPLDVVARITPVPVLFLHGERDWLIRPEHSRLLFERAREPKRLLIMKHAGHAEKIFDDYPDDFIRICRDWFSRTL